MSGFELIDVTPSEGYVIDEKKEREVPPSQRLFGEIAMLQRCEGGVDPMYRSLYQNIKARLALIRKDVEALEARLQNQQEITNGS
jgi:hypothetical protein